MNTDYDKVSDVIYTPPGWPRSLEATLYQPRGVGRGCTTSTPLPTPHAGARVNTDYDKVSDVIYTPPGWPRSLEATLNQPRGVGPWPTVLLLYGGSWDSSDHRWWMTLIARKLASRGYFVMNAVYRGTPEFQYPAPVDDLREAIRWVHTHAIERGLNPKQIAVYGFSAGGHLASLLGTLAGPPDTHVQAVIAFSAPSDLTLFQGGEILPRLLGATYAQDPKRFIEASPVTHVSADDPPFFLYHGTADTTVPPEHARRMKAALDRAGVRNELRWVEGRGHAAMLLRAGAAEDVAIDFLDSIFRP